jgi:3-deoxy-D-manno-octulosonic-acid transferase
MGSVKFDTAPTELHVSGAEELAANMGIAADQPLWVCGSTGPGEERYVLDAYRELLTQQPRLQLAIIPRKPERFDEVARLIAQQGFPCRRRSKCDGSPSTGAGMVGAGAVNGTDPSTPAVLLGDTMGELRKFYSLAAVVFVGRSLVPMGGSDVIEVAALAKPMLVGPHTVNFADAIRRLRERQALIETNPQRLAADVSAVLNDAALAERLGRSAHEVVQANRGATSRAIDSLHPFLS